jgi:hypothetical protein
MKGGVRGSTSNNVEARAGKMTIKAEIDERNSLKMGNLPKKGSFLILKLSVRNQSEFSTK